MDGRASHSPFGPPKAEPPVALAFQVKELSTEDGEDEDGVGRYCTRGSWHRY